MRTLLVAALVAILSAPAALAASFEDMFPGVAEQMPEDLRPGLEAMDLKQGHTQIGAIAFIDVPEGYYFLGPKDAEFVLTTLWGNPDASQTLGMLFPRDRSPADGAAWERRSPLTRSAMSRTKMQRAMTMTPCWPRCRATPGKTTRSAMRTAMSASIFWAGRRRHITTWKAASFTGPNG